MRYTTVVYVDEPVPWSAQVLNYLPPPSSFSTPSLGVAVPVLCPVLALDKQRQQQNN